MERYMVDQISPLHWLVLDKDYLDAAYYVVLTPIETKIFNWQITIASVLFESTEELVMYKEELLAFGMYAANQDYLTHLAEAMLQTLEDQSFDIHNPVELSAMFGGCFKNSQVELPPVVFRSNLH